MIDSRSRDSSGLPDHPSVPFGVETAFDALDEPVSVFKRDGGYAYINPAGQLLLGRSRAELSGRTYLDAFPDLIDHPFHEAFARLVAGQSTVERLEFYYAPLDLWSSQRMYAVADHVIVFWQDITERKRAEAALHESQLRTEETEQQFQTMIESMPQLAWRARPDGFIDYYNPRWYEYTGTTAADMEGWGWQSVHDRALLPRVMERWQHSIASGEPFEMEFPLRRHDGTFRWFLTRVTPSRAEDGQIVRWFGINTDIDDQRRALALVGDTLESMSDAFFLLDTKWRVVRVNRNQEKVSATPRDRSIGQNFWELFPATADPTSKYWLEYHRVMTERVDSHFEEYYAPLDLWTEVDAFPSADGGIAVFFRDISDRKRLELQRGELLAREQAARAAAETANRTKDEFLAMLGHELRNPLAPIATALQLMRIPGVQDRRRELSVIERQVTHLVRLVDDLLDVSRITRGKVELKLSRLEVSDLVARAIETAGPLIEQRQHRVSVEIEPGLAVDGDADRLSQVLANLLTNAAKYTPPGGLITIAGSRAGDIVELRVSDTGAGIAPDLLPRVFDMFVQGRQELDRGQGGLGLGLTIVRRLVELHGGGVTAANNGLATGATFAVRLPSPATEPPGLVPTLVAAPSSQPARRQVLIVDDNEDAAEMLAALLQSKGMVTRTAYDGPTALQVIETFKPDVAILDIGLPVMNGYELARALRARTDLTSIRLLALTGYGQADDLKRAVAAGFDHHLIKPVDTAKLTALVLEEPAKPGGAGG
ncbi:MAG: PAS domain-containing protein [Kofleriaceae bacterium]